MIIVSQLRAARGLVNLTQQGLAAGSGVALSTIRRMERGEGTIRGTAENVWKVQAALERAGVKFIDSEEGIGGPGVRLRRRPLMPITRWSASCHFLRSDRVFLRNETNYASIPFDCLLHTHSIGKGVVAELKSRGSPD